MVISYIYCHVVGSHAILAELRLDPVPGARRGGGGCHSLYSHHPPDIMVIRAWPGCVSHGTQWPHIVVKADWFSIQISSRREGWVRVLNIDANSINCTMRDLTVGEEFGNGGNVLYPNLKLACKVIKLTYWRCLVYQNKQKTAACFVTAFQMVIFKS